MAAKKEPFKISHPGALTAQKRPGETMLQTAERLAANGTPEQKRQANFYLHVLRPASKKRKGTGSGSPSAEKTARETHATRMQEHNMHRGS